MESEKLKVFVVIVALMVIVLSIVYIITQKMIPGLLPLLLAILMGISLWNMYKKDKNRNIKSKKSMYVLFWSACIGNVFVAILQII